MLALDGASLDYISLEVAEGRLPNFGRILAAGAAMHLATLRPTQPATVWTAIATGKYPPKNGVRSAAMYGYAPNEPPVELLPDLCFAHALVRLGILREIAQTSSSLRARPVWSILSSQRVPVGVIGWTLTDPVEPLRGFLLTENFYRSLLAPLEFSEQNIGYPPQAVLDAQVFERSQQQSSSTDPASSERPPMPRDARYRDVAIRLREAYHPRFFTVRYEGLDRAGHLFLRFALPDAFGDVTDQERQRYGTLLDEHYAYIDAEVGRAMAEQGPEDLLLIVSGFGMQPVSLGKRLLAKLLSEPDVTGSHERAPDGFLLAYGEAVKPGRAPLGSVVDVAPTILYFLGLPVARDMDGYARTDILKPTFTTARPITFIPTYER
jgi:predicted AlkP superfamily phosphohydrolase/phosphomutase